MREGSANGFGSAWASPEGTVPSSDSPAQNTLEQHVTLAERVVTIRGCCVFMFGLFSLAGYFFEILICDIIYYHWRSIKRDQNSLRLCFIFLKFFIFFLSHSCSMWKFLAQGSNPHHSSDPGHCSENARPLSHWAKGNSLSWVLRRAFQCSTNQMPVDSGQCGKSIKYLGGLTVHFEQRSIIIRLQMSRARNAAKVGFKNHSGLARVSWWDWDATLHPETVSNDEPQEGGKGSMALPCAMGLPHQDQHFELLLGVAVQHAVVASASETQSPLPGAQSTQWAWCMSGLMMGPGSKGGSLGSTGSIHSFFFFFFSF